MNTNTINQNSIQSFVAGSGKPRYIFGRNHFAKAVAAQVLVDGFIDEYTTDPEFEGRPVVHRLSDLPAGSLVLNCLIGIYPVTIQQKIAAAGFEAIDYFSFLKHSGLTLPGISFWSGFHEHYAQHEDAYTALLNDMADETSYRTMQALLDFRLNYNLSAMQEFRENQKNQYFEDFLHFRNSGEAFADVGAYDGYTSQEFIRLCPGYSHVYVVEPDQVNMDKARTLLKDQANISYISSGIWDSKTVLRFNSGQGSVSNVDPEGEISIPVDTLDNLIDGPVTFIKMDIEGSEAAALRGAAGLIKTHHPRLAICVYHKGPDLLEIPQLVRSIRSDYKIYLRQYTEGVVETVMFFIPDTQHG